MYDKKNFRKTKIEPPEKGNDERQQNQTPVKRAPKQRPRIIWHP
jgi:hypothetical protein